MERGRSPLARSTSALSIRGSEAICLLAQRLESAGLPPRIVRFALFGDDRVAGSGGADRNVMLLSAAGDCLLFMPTRVLCRPVAGTPGGGPLILRENADEEPRRRRVGRNRTDEYRTDMDILAIHERLLGRSLAEVVHGHSIDASVDLTHACAHIVDSLRRGRGRIVATLAEIARADCFAVDARVPVPPFLLCGSGERVFFSLLTRCSTHSYFSQLPFAFPAMDAGTDTRPDAGLPGAVTASDLVDACIASVREPISADPSECLKEMGCSLCEITSLDESDFRDYLRLALWSRVGDEIARLEQLASQRDSPTLRNELQRWIRACRDVSGGVDLLVSDVSDVRRHRAQSSVSNTVRDILDLFGQLLGYWPDMFHICQSQE